ncbi:MAG TPA: elongation factor Ts [Herpetosiphon sp.]|uniref:Elongation factor Ts n=2 Tax=Herpetosiphon TaxID=64 RepID=EFTS_HERA2|nr:translation elongation factor Ts [Herpetosiphon sp.]A9B457.1 RecName: Full=Elongation factor Ts; Short=EF-Ts [Herpetosiphon aurantiacus DSM 785]ABX07590.1 translation elongation factor Ts [Herpetosiphon aurantiacus DSM 785]HBW49634.1 elongation factor Ts [Herpetosiphon sp.]
MSISMDQVKELRERTGAGILDCKKALTDTSGDVDAAIKILREKGLAAAAKKSSRDASDGRIEVYVHPGNKVVAIVEVNCETDFVAKTDDFKKLAYDLALHVAATNPSYVNREEVPAAEVEREREILRQQNVDSGKPANIVEKIVEGRIEKFYGEIVLLEQEFVKDPSVKIKDLVQEAIAKLGENIVVRRFSRFEVGSN